MWSGRTFVRRLFARVHKIDHHLKLNVGARSDFADIRCIGLVHFGAVTHKVNIAIKEFLPIVAVKMSVVRVLDNSLADDLSLSLHRASSRIVPGVSAVQFEALRSTLSTTVWDV